MKCGDNYAAIESDLHELFKKDRLKGEWFTTPAEKAIEVLVAAQKANGYVPPTAATIGMSLIDITTVVADPYGNPVEVVLEYTKEQKAVLRNNYIRMDHEVYVADMKTKTALML